jgi:hypothetical protein
LERPANDLIDVDDANNFLGRTMNDQKSAVAIRRTARQIFRKRVFVRGFGLNPRSMQFPAAANGRNKLITVAGVGRTDDDSAQRSHGAFWNLG